MPDPSEQKTSEFKAFQVLRPTADVLTDRPVRVQAAGETHTGLVRTRNEDHFLVARISRSLEVLSSNLPPEVAPASGELDGYILAVADGVGGLAAGERASSLVIAKGIELILASASWGLRLDQEMTEGLLARMREYLVKLNDSLRQAVEADASLAGMATTLSAVYSVGLRAFIVHVGDSRVYLLRDEELTQLTRDHTIAQDLADQGTIAPAEIRRHPRRHVLTNVIAGKIGFHQPDLASHLLMPNDVLLLCSDGLSDLLEPDVMTRLLQENPRPADACAALIDAALEAGGRDNVSAVVAHYGLADG